MALHFGEVSNTMYSPEKNSRQDTKTRAYGDFRGRDVKDWLGFGLLVHPLAWFVLRFIMGASVGGLYMVVESWLNEQSAGPARGRVFAVYMMGTLIALGAGQFLLLAYDPAGLGLFFLAAILIALSLVPIVLTRVQEPHIEVSVAFGLTHLYRPSPLGTMGVFCAGLVNGVFWGMAPLFDQRLALDEIQIATLMSATILGGVLLQWPIGH